MTVGKRIKYFRMKANLSQVKLADLAEMETTNINRIENGKSVPLVQTLIKICNALNVTPNDLLLFDYKVPMEMLQGELAEIVKDLKEEEIKTIIDYAEYIRHKSLQQKNL